MTVLSKVSEGVGGEGGVVKGWGGWGGAGGRGGGMTQTLYVHMNKIKKKPKKHKQLINI
jgi:hypothetical protein